jgi:hypothetical protein
MAGVSFVAHVDGCVVAPWADCFAALVWRGVGAGEGERIIEVTEVAIDQGAASGYQGGTDGAVHWYVSRISGYSGGRAIPQVKADTGDTDLGAEVVVAPDRVTVTANLRRQCADRNMSVTASTLGARMPGWSKTLSPAALWRRAAEGPDLIINPGEGLAIRMDDAGGAGRSRFVSVDMLLRRTSDGAVFTISNMLCPQSKDQAGAFVAIFSPIGGPTLEVHSMCACHPGPLNAVTAGFRLAQIEGVMTGGNDFAGRSGDTVDIARMDTSQTLPSGLVAYRGPQVPTLYGGGFNLPDDRLTTQATGGTGINYQQRAGTRRRFAHQASMIQRNASTACLLTQSVALYKDEARPIVLRSGQALGVLAGVGETSVLHQDMAEVIDVIFRGRVVQVGYTTEEIASAVWNTTLPLVAVAVEDPPSAQNYADEVWAATIP